MAQYDLVHQFKELGFSDIAFGIGHQRDNIEPRQGPGKGNQFDSVGHLRQQRWWHKAADLNLGHTGLGGASLGARFVQVLRTDAAPRCFVRLC